METTVASGSAQKKVIFLLLLSFFLPSDLRHIYVKMMIFSFICNLLLAFLLLSYNDFNLNEL